MEELSAFGEKDFKNNEVNELMRKLDERVWKKLIIKLKAERFIQKGYLVRDKVDAIHLEPRDLKDLDRDIITMHGMGATLS